MLQALAGADRSQAETTAKLTDLSDSDIVLMFIVCRHVIFFFQMWRCAVVVGFIRI